MKVRQAVLLATAMLLLPMGAAWADRDHDRDRDRGRRGDDDRGHDRGRHRGHHKDKDRVVIIEQRPVIVEERVVMWRDRPPAPRYQRFYELPVGIEEGRCDRNLIDANVGTLLGAAAGGFLGAQVGRGDGQLAATGAGVLLGALIGNQIQANVQSADAGCMTQALERAPDRQTIIWDDPQGGRYEMTPVRSYEQSPGTYCREYTSKARIGGRTKNVTGTACRQPDGQWQIVS
jgi:surface antigen